MSMRWETSLELKKKKSNLSDSDRKVLITDRIEELSGKQCFYTQKKVKKCSCLSSLQGDGVAMDAVASYILFWAKMDPLQQKILLIEKTFHYRRNKAISASILSNRECRNKFEVDFHSYMQAFFGCFAFVWCTCICFSWSKCKGKHATCSWQCRESKQAITWSQRQCCAITERFFP